VSLSQADDLVPVKTLSPRLHRRRAFFGSMLALAALLMLCVAPASAGSEEAWPLVSAGSGCRLVSWRRLPVSAAQLERDLFVQIVYRPR
jgi:hypothetical protein